jgi:hypothetical protein
MTGSIVPSVAAGRGPSHKEPEVLVDLVRDGWLQLRRRPLAAVLMLGITGMGLLTSIAPHGSPSWVAGLLSLLALAGFVLGFLAQLFVIPYLAGALRGEPSDARAAWRVTLRSIGPAVRAVLLLVMYMFTAFLATLVIASVAIGAAGVQPTGDPGRQSAWVLAGLVPLMAFAYALLATLLQRILLDGEQRVLQAARVSHRIAAKNFGVCLLFGVLQLAMFGVAWIQPSAPVLAAAGLASTLLHLLIIGAENSLYLRTRDAALASLEEASKSRQP